ncbi:uncharacterized protein LOC141686320 [Apium graveolens]|uniref:uncharacterized protein LOC141686320 n=1 Tax=Apium graveolens TaxID=4045 RepID=UPI003D7A7CEB
MGITDLLCRALQHKSLDIVSAMYLVSTTKSLLVTLREEGFDHLFVYVQSIYTQYGIEIPDMNSLYKSATGHSCQQKDSMTICQHYHFDIFNSAIDFQQEELHSRFSDEAVELLTLTSALDPKDNFRSFKAEDIYKLAEKFYPGDFSEQELHYLRNQLEHYKLDVIHHTSFQNMTTINELCHRLIETNKVQHYNLIDRLIQLVLTLPVSTATAERSFSSMKLIKTALRNKMEEEFLADSMLINIERELVEDIESDSIIDEFYSMKNQSTVFCSFDFLNMIFMLFLAANLRRADLIAKQRARDDAVMALEFIKDIHDMMVSKMYTLPLHMSKVSSSANKMAGRITHEKNGISPEFIHGEVFDV